MTFYETVNEAIRKNRFFCVKGLTTQVGLFHLFILFQKIRKIKKDKDKALLFQYVSSENGEMCIGFSCLPIY